MMNYLSFFGFREHSQNSKLVLHFGHLYSVVRSCFPNLVSGIKSAGELPRQAGQNG